MYLDKCATSRIKNSYFSTTDRQHDFKMGKGYE
jgi:hypothetical protein